MSETNTKQIFGDTEFEQVCDFVTQLILQAHRYGVSFVRLQTFTSQLPQLFGIHGHMLAAPPFLFFEFSRPTDTQPYRIIHPLPDGSFELTKLSFLGSLLNDLSSGKASLVEAPERLKQIDSFPPPYKNPLVALGYCLCGSGFAVLLSAAWSDLIFAAVLSLVVFAITMYARRSQWIAERINFASAVVTSILASIIALLFPGSNAFTVALCAVIVLIPGLSLTVGVAELASKSTITGINRLVDGILITFALVVGSAAGSSIVNAFWIVPAPFAPPGYSLFFAFISVVFIMLGLALIFQVRPRDLVWVILGGIIAYTGIVIGGQFGNWQGSFLGALGLGIYSTLVVDRLFLPSSVIMLPGIMILVPGVAAYFGLDTLQTSGIIGGLQAIWGVVVQIAAIIGGLFIAASVLSQKASL